MKYQILTENEIIEYKTSERLIQCFLDDWNNQNPSKKLDPGTIDLITDYFRYAYVSGFDDHRLIIEKILKRSGLTINKYFFEKLLKDFEQEL